MRRSLDVALPRLCPSCRDLVTDNGLCPACWSKLAFIAPPYCPRLGIPFAYDPGPGILSMQAIADPPAYQRARAAVRYDDVARALVHAFKYGDRLDLAPLLGALDGARRRGTARRCRRAGAGAAALAAAVDAALQPVGRARGAISRDSGVAVAHDGAARASRRRRSRSGCRAPDRATNVQGAFRVAPAAKAEVAGRRLILIDDVLTSGATSDACARALLRAGAAQVDVLVLARVVDAAKAPI